MDKLVIFRNELICLVLFLPAVGCSAPGPAPTAKSSMTRGIEEVDRMKEVIAAELPPGTPIDEAQRFMEREGFECSYLSDDPSESRDGRRTFLYCDRSDKVARLVYRRWQVWAYYDRGKMVEVGASVGRVGL
jgi:hypothetical protein